MTDIIIRNLASPAILFFLLGLIAALVKSDLKFPKGLSETLSIYLLIAIGLKGGIELSQHSFTELVRPLVGTLFLGIFIPIVTFVICRRIGIDRKNATAIAATYGSVSIVTFGAAISFLELTHTSYEPYMNAFVVLLESPAIIVSLLILQLLEKETYALNRMNHYFSAYAAYTPVLKESLFGKSVLLMLGSLLIGLLGGKNALSVVKPLFIDLYPSVLILFLLGMGLTAGSQLAAIRKYGVKLVMLGIGFPVLYGLVGVFVGTYAHLSLGGTVLMGVLAASASYIAAPAAMRASVPEANPSIYLGMSLGLTFPFNLTVGLPLYYQLAQWLHS
ncbi:MAG: sodium-dependent bicarbonate transport family permease [Anoxybacillus sp.]|nr:sodium-dependent bicarbonate transport family permease [Anoxybacillus sp.]MCL6585674.1 sodium-dependent bicarbonate transport family permease [Anoxybacillus sp.]